jgi:hypothetical protein
MFSKTRKSGIGESLGEDEDGQHKTISDSFPIFERMLPGANAPEPTGMRPRKNQKSTRHLSKRQEDGNCQLCKPCVPTGGLSTGNTGGSVGI